MKSEMRGGLDDTNVVGLPANTAGALPNIADTGVIAAAFISARRVIEWALGAL